MNNLRDNQINAKNNFTKHYYYEGNTRGILSMCCASGKTRAFYEILKICISKEETFFIYTTSKRILIKDIICDLIEWLYYENININILIKSDITKTEIESKINKSRIKIINNNVFDKDKFNTYKNNIKLLSPDISDIADSIISRYHSNILLITTYDSIGKIYEAINFNNAKDNKYIDIIPNLLVADEAHNLVSNDNNIKRAKKILEDVDNLCTPDKFLFMTATPLKIIKRNSTSNFINNDIIYSMDNENLYGKVFYEYTFYEGIRDNYILDFDIIYLDNFDNNEDIRISDLIKELDKEEQQSLYFETISRILLLVICKYNLTHTIIYLSNQAKVKYMYEILKKHIKNNDLECSVYSIISSQKEDEKKTNHKNFENNNNTKHNLLLSVNILDEGIDIPICDSIFFAEERNSETTIVQNIGRSLRKHINKNKAYVIIPTNVYKCNENYYSSRFTKIRDVCKILKEEPSDIIKFYNRYTKGNTKTFTNKDDIDEINDKSELVDNILEINDNYELVDNIEEVNNKYESNNNIQLINSLVETLVLSSEIKSNNEDISNLTFNEFKKKVRDARIQTLAELTTFIEICKIPFDSAPHCHYKKDWISYSYLLFNKVFTYEESIECIESLKIINLTSPKEWYDYYNNIIDEGLKNKCENFDLLNKIIYIPYNPKSYYIGEWKENGWSDFLNRPLNNTTGLEINSSLSSSSLSINLTNNIKNLINDNKETIKKLIAPEKYHTYKICKTDITPVKEYINMIFNINCILELRYTISRSNLLKCVVIYIKKNISDYRILITIHPLLKNKILYDKDYNIYFDNNLEYKPNRDIEEYIINQDVNNTIDNILNELKEYINNYRNNIN